MTEQILCAFMATFGFAVMLNVPKKYLIYASSVGTFAWFIYLILLNNGADKRMAVFWASFGVAILAHIYARIIKAPVTIFLIPGIFTLVPGEGMYNIVSQMIQGKSTLAGNYLSQTIQLAGMIALGVFMADSLVRIRKDIRNNSSFKNRHTDCNQDK